MSLGELLPNINALSRAEKLQLIRLLAHDLAEGEESTLIPANRSYPVWSPDQAFSAAEAMLRALQDDKDRP